PDPKARTARPGATSWTHAQVGSRGRGVGRDTRGPMIHRCCWLAAVLLGLASGCAGSPQTAAPATNEPASATSAAPAPASEPAGEPHAQAHEHEPEHHSSAAHDPPDKFDDAAKWSKVFDDPKRDAWQKPDEVVRELGLQPDDVVADLGAGTGYFSLRLARAVPKGRVLA